MMRIDLQFAQFLSTNCFKRWKFSKISALRADFFPLGFIGPGLLVLPAGGRAGAGCNANQNFNCELPYYCWYTIKALDIEKGHSGNCNSNSLKNAGFFYRMHAIVLAMDPTSICHSCTSLSDLR